jgi:hypothetical protein
MRGAMFFGGVMMATFVVIACGSKTRSPAYTQQPTSALTPVPFPPPPARAETVPESPRDDAVWLDGEWVWQTRRWAWRKGRWVVPPSGAKFAPWTTVRDATGNLYVATGSWRNAIGDEVTVPPPLGQAHRPGTGVVTPEGEPVDIGQPATSASAMHAGHEERREVREFLALDASGPPSLALDAAVTDQLLDASASERAPRVFFDGSASGPYVAPPSPPPPSPSTDASQP